MEVWYVMMAYIWCGECGDRKVLHIHLRSHSQDTLQNEFISGVCFVVSH